MDEDAIAAVVKEIEEEKALGRVSAVQVFKSILNQPSLVSISSASAAATDSTDGYTGFTVNMPRPILSVNSLELMTANIPLCTQNIPDTACVFWYYRLSMYNNKYPTPNNLFWVRLLPSYYKPEFIRDYPNYGYNQTFDGYTNVATQLALATASDLAQVNFVDSDPAPPYYRLQYLPDNEVKITYDSTINKFKFAGNFGLPQDEQDPVMISDNYAAGTTYALDDVVKDTTYVQGWGYLCYKSMTAGNIGHPLPVYPATETAYWVRDYNADGVADYSTYTAYKRGQYVAYNDSLYRCNPNGVYSSELGAFQKLPTDTTYWTIDTTGASYTPLYRYMATGPLDPNVAFMQGNSQRTWSQYTLYEEGDYILYNGITYRAYTQTLGTEPFYVPNATDNAYSAGVSYKIGQYVYYSGKYYICIKDTKGNAPTGAYTNNTWWAFIEYDPAKTNYAVNDIITYVGYSYVPFWRCIKPNPPASSLTGSDPRFGGSAYWQPSYWSTGTAVTNVPYVGLAKISSQFDMLDDLFGSIQYPFPEGIPPQPFVNDPKRILNSILGFTWNGKFTPSMLSVIYDQIAVVGSTTVTQLINRLRPVPSYVVYGLSGTSAAGSVSLDPTFTANGYGNLVYSSIINIYASITGGSSLDTVRNTNLLGTMPMNAGNLGIGFAANFIKCSLEAQDGDIYSVTFSFTDEFGDPYPLTNNAVVTMTLKMGYRSKVAVNNAEEV